MAADKPINFSSIDPISGFCSETGIYHSLRPAVPLPSLTAPLSITEYVFQLLHRAVPIPSPERSPQPQALIDASTRRRIPFPELVRRSNALANFIQQRIGLRRGDVAFILSSNSVNVPILYLSLFSCGVIVSPSNPVNSKSEISFQIQLCKPAIAFASSDSAFKVPPLPLGTVLLDTLEFDSMMTTTTTTTTREAKADDSSFRPLMKICQSHTAAILYSSGTTGRVKGVELTHRNIISVIDGMYNSRGASSSRNSQSPAVNMINVPYFHVYGFVQCLRAVAFGETLVSIAAGRFDLQKMVMVIKEFKVTHLATATAILVAVTKKVDDVRKFDMRSLEVLACGGAPVPGSVVEMFKAQFPWVQLSQGYGLTESTGGVIRTVGAEECGRMGMGSTGKLMPFVEAKIVDPETGTISTINNSQGELWLRGPSIMKGYVGDVEATAVALDSDGWLKTGDLCYFDSEGFLYVKDRLKELIKYKGYQVAPVELENVLQSHPDILDAAVIPFIPRPRSRRNTHGLCSETTWPEVHPRNRCSEFHQHAGCSIQESKTGTVYCPTSKKCFGQGVKKGTNQACTIIHHFFFKAVVVDPNNCSCSCRISGRILHSMTLSSHYYL